MNDTSPDALLPNLLPCPFCGSTEGLDFSEGSTFRWRLAECKGCGANTGEERHNTLADNQVEAENDTRIRLMKTWNTRIAHAPADPVQPVGSQWQPIETAPKDGTLIFGLYRYGASYDDYGIVRWTSNWNSDGSGSWTDQFCDQSWMEPTYWQPLPEPPK